MHESNIRPRLFDNKHAVIKDAAQANKNWIETFLASWTDEEKTLFRERLAAVGKNYANIAMFLENKPPVMPTPEELAMYQLVPQDALTEAQSSASQDSKCVMCQLRIDPTTNPGRVLTRSNYEMYASASQDSKCVMCQLRIDPTTNPGRILTRSNYEMYGK
ncbi:hypothetical protein ANCCAN_21072 [Ancylostoma caninum]|uniref:Uncharacterized protein n=1 Tax=Ancylostoma caninum TaxID=29170 RepID=A0A368FLU7_ANCCA|nr:hypothetical protein ANCCAN_21072 [Ancylostoma caninum]